ncbi:MAG TPA: transcription termination factor NusA [Candidatus Omnitrophota bacterium]|nr:transcription termination factor NusA [Candidatus Omnitrophota bacterium]
MNGELLSSFQYIEKEKNISREVLINALRSALLSACKKTFPNPDDFDIVIEAETLKIKVLEKGQEVHRADFGRIAAQTAKQVIMQKLREAEREAIFNDFSKSAGEIINGMVHAVDRKAIVVDLGKAEAILPIREQVPRERYFQGNTIRAYVLEVKASSRGPEVILSRVHPNFLSKLFELEIPEIREGIVEIKAVAREAGARSKIAVCSHDEKVDCVGSCVGMRGQRVKNIVNELGGEKIDIVRWSADPETFIRNALSPAELSKIKISADDKRAEVIVNDDQYLLAAGKRDQNVRLASRLTGWAIEVFAASQKIPLTSLEGVGEELAEALKNAGFRTIQNLSAAKAEDLAAVPGVGPQTAEKIILAAQKAALSGGTEAKKNDGEKH